MEAPAVSKFREYLRIKTVHFEPDYGKFKFFLFTKTKSIKISRIKI